ncbi:hypothetical protein Ae201684P_003174 [Aphanomyces euteiches]|uniref:Uncharacterized protein n=1 Tax=Aphanomyces euteiches TaxID=100861 RepID=A0A6G0WD47_9STRA|nr:hypothetical protein Ae201684_016950 [Aphanomyces euteiches]KAH9073671.1 hypothetical protein Ae201684P_003174 [Aphanomyces euteiches]
MKPKVSCGGKQQLCSNRSNQNSALHKSSTNPLVVGVGLFGGLLLAETHKAGISTSQAESLDDRVVLQGFRDGGGRHFLGRTGNGEDSTDVLGHVLGFFHLGVTSLRLGSTLAREQDQLGLVRLQALHIRLERFDRLVGAAVVDRDTNRQGLLARDTGFLQFVQGETTASAHFRAILDRRAVHGRAQETSSRTRGNGGSLSLASQAAGLLLRGLVKPRLDAVLPILMEVAVRDHVVVLHGDYETRV